jgi:hypothetical protein
LPTYSDEDGPRKAGNDEEAQVIFNGGGASSNGALARGTSLAAAVMIGAPPSSGSTWEDSVRWISSCVLRNQWQLGGGRQGHWGASIYRGKEGEDHVHARESIPN